MPAIARYRGAAAVSLHPLTITMIHDKGDAGSRSPIVQPPIVGETDSIISLLHRCVCRRLEPTAGVFVVSLRWWTSPRASHVTVVCACDVLVSLT